MNDIFTISGMRTLNYIATCHFAIFTFQLRRDVHDWCRVNITHHRINWARRGMKVFNES